MVFALKYSSVTLNQNRLAMKFHYINLPDSLIQSDLQTSEVPKSIRLLDLKLSLMQQGSLSSLQKV